jgi:hypothetical protein
MSQTAAWQTEAEAAQNAPFAMVKIELPTATVRFFTGVGELTWDSQTWTGAGDLGFIGPLESSTELRAGRVEIGLSGLDASVKADALNELARGANVYIYLGFFDTATDAIVADPWLAFFGKVDQPSVTEKSDGIEIVVSCLDGVGAALRRTEHRRNSADQEGIFSGDEVFEFVADTKPANWGGPTAGGGAGSATGAGINTGSGLAPGRTLRDY